MTTSKSDVATLAVDGKSLTTLHQMQLVEMCPQIKEVTLIMQKTMKLDALFTTSSSFPQLVQLGLVGPRKYLLSLEQSETFCKRLMTSYPRLTGLTFTDIGLGNKGVIDTIGYLRHHKTISKIG